MDEFAAGTDVFLTFPHSNNGSELNVTDLQYQLLDSEGTVLIDYVTAPSFDPATTSTIITILNTFNDTSEKVDVRQVNVKFVTTSGTYKQTAYYKLIGDQTQLTVMVDSFMTYPESVIVRAKMSDRLEYFDILTDSLKAVALENAFETIVKLPFNLYPSTYNYNGTVISSLTEQQFKVLANDFQLAIKKAQLLQANTLVEYSPVRDKIRQGIISETIGESSMFFKQGGAIGSNTKFPNLSDDAYAYLSKFLFKSAANAQIWHVRRA